MGEETEVREVAAVGQAKATPRKLCRPCPGSSKERQEEREKSAAGKLGDRRNSQRNGVSRKSAAARQKHQLPKSIAPTLFVMEQ